MATTAKRKTVLQFGFRGEGETLREARADYQKQVDAALDATYDVTLLSYRGHTGVLWRSPTGYEYRIQETAALAADGVHRVGVCSMLGAVSRDAAVAQLAHHILQWYATEFHTDADIPAFLADARLRRELIGYGRWQRAAQHARAHVSEDSTVIHRWACDHEHDPEFV